MKKITLVLLLMSQFLMAQKDTVYINPDATGNGSGDSWENGITHVGTLGFYNYNDKIVWIKKGVYEQKSPFPQFNVAFFLPRKIEIYGGFNGNETSLEERNLEQNITVLDGDGSVNVLRTIFEWGDSTEYLVLDGLEVINGSGYNENPSIPWEDLLSEMTYNYYPYSYFFHGGALFSFLYPKAKVHIKNCRFHDNNIRRHSMVSIVSRTIGNDSVYIENNKFNMHENNSGIFVSLGYLKSDSYIYFSNNLVEGGVNSMPASFLEASNIIISNNYFSNNFLGLMYNFKVFFTEDSYCIVKDNIFHKNIWGGYNNYTSGSIIQLENNIFIENELGFGFGGANFDESSNYYGIDDFNEYNTVNFKNNFFLNNYKYGAIISLSKLNLNISNCLFYNNSSVYEGAAIRGHADTINVSNCIFKGNTSETGIHDIYSSFTEVHNCLFDKGSCESLGQLNYYFEDYRDTINNTWAFDTIYESGLVCNNNLFNQDPQFIDETNQDFHLRLCSPAIDAGTNEVISQGSTDYDGNPRIINNTVDIGPYEFDLASYSIEVEDVSCQTGSDGAINLLGGIEGYDITWESNGQTGSNLEGLNGGTYHLSISNGDCFLERTIEIHEPDHFGIKSKIGQDDGSNSGFIRIDSVFNGVAPYQLDWDTGAMGNEIIDLATGAYRLSVTDSKGCLTTFEFFIEDVSAVSDYLSSSIQVSPNPASDFVKLQVDGFEIDKIEIYDIQGTKIKVVTSSQSNFNKIDVSNLVNGTYFLRLKSGDLFGFKKMIILK